MADPVPPAEPDGAAPDASRAAPAPTAPAPQHGEPQAAAAATPRVSLGRVGKPHGLAGLIHVTRPRADSLVVGITVTVDGVEREIVHRGGTPERPVLRLAGVDGIDEAERLRGSDLLVARESLPPLDEDEFWPDDLVGLPVRSTAGAAVGEVRNVLVLPSVDVLEVARPGAPDLLVPLHREAVPELDVPAGRVVVDLEFMGEDAPGGGA